MHLPRPVTLLVFFSLKLNTHEVSLWLAWLAGSKDTDYAFHYYLFSDKLTMATAFGVGPFISRFRLVRSNSIFALSCLYSNENILEWR